MARKGLYRATAAVWGEPAPLPPERRAAILETLPALTPRATERLFRECEVALGDYGLAIEYPAKDYRPAGRSALAELEILRKAGAHFIKQAPELQRGLPAGSRIREIMEPLDRTLDLIEMARRRLERGLSEPEGETRGRPAKGAEQGLVWRLSYIWQDSTGEGARGRTGPFARFVQAVTEWPEHDVENLLQWWQRERARLKRMREK